MQNDYLKLWRDVRDMDIYYGEKFTRFHSWIDLLLEAATEERTIFIRGNQIILQRGQLAVSIRGLSESWNLSVNTTQKRLSELEESGYIHIQRSKLTNVITICDFDRYFSEPHSIVRGSNSEFFEKTDTQNDTQKVVDNQIGYSGTRAEKLDNTDTQNDTQNDTQKSLFEKTDTQNDTQKPLENHVVYGGTESSFSGDADTLRVHARAQSSPTTNNSNKQEYNNIFSSSSSSTRAHAHTREGEFPQSLEEKQKLSERLEEIVDSSQDFETECLNEAKTPNTQWMQAVCMQTKLSHQQVCKYLDDFHLTNLARLKVHNSGADFKRHFMDWLRCRREAETRSASLKQGFTPKTNIQRSATAVDTSQMNYDDW